MINIKAHQRGVRRDMARLLIDQASLALVYLGIFATFAVASVIACLFWLLIW
jgi:hypothetical protein